MAENLTDFRREIDGIDHKILELLAQRFEVCRKIATHKHHRGMPMKQPEREREMRARNAELAARYGLSEALVNRLFEQIIEASLELEVKPDSEF